MAAYDIVYEYVQDDVGRPELAELISRRIKRAVMDAHRIDFWKKDLIEQIFAFQYTQSVQIINTNLFPRFRAVGYIRKWNPYGVSNADPSIFNGEAGQMFKEINPQNVFDGYGYDRRNTIYQSGTTLKLNSSEAIQQVLFAWFQDPLIEPIETSQSWILAGYPNLIAAMAKRRIFKDLGKDEEARSSAEEMQEQILILQANNIRLAVLQQPG